MVNRIGIKNYQEINDGSSKYTHLFHTLLKEDLSKIKVLFNGLKDSESHKFYENEDLLIYLPENYIVQKPLNLHGKELKIDSIDFTLKLLNKEGPNESVGFSTNSILYKYNIDGQNKTNEENNVIFQNFSEIETSLYPVLYQNEDGELMVSKPIEKRKYYLKLFYGIRKGALLELLNNVNNYCEEN